MNRNLIFLLLALTVLPLSVPADLVTEGEIKKKFSITNLDDYPEYIFYVKYRTFYYDMGYNEGTPEFKRLEEGVYYLAGERGAPSTIHIRKKNKKGEPKGKYLAFSEQYVGGDSIVHDNSAAYVLELFEIAGIEDDQIQLKKTETFIVKKNGQQVPVKRGSLSGWTIGGIDVLYLGVPVFCLALLVFFFLSKNRARGRVATILLLGSLLSAGTVSADLVPLDDRATPVEPEEQGMVVKLIAYQFRFLNIDHFRQKAGIGFGYNAEDDFGKLHINEIGQGLAMGVELKKPIYVVPYIDGEDPGGILSNHKVGGLFFVPEDITDIIEEWVIDSVDFEEGTIFISKVRTLVSDDNGAVYDTIPPEPYIEDEEFAPFVPAPPATPLGPWYVFVPILCGLLLILLFVRRFAPARFRGSTAVPRRAARSLPL